MNSPFDLYGKVRGIALGFWVLLLSLVIASVLLRLLHCAHLMTFAYALVSALTLLYPLSILYLFAYSVNR